MSSEQAVVLFVFHALNDTPMLSLTAPGQFMPTWLALAAAFACLHTNPGLAQAQASSTTPSALQTLPDVQVRSVSPSALPDNSRPGRWLITPRAPGHHDTAQLLNAAPGLSTYGAGGVSGLPVIRGLADHRLRILVDGVDAIASCPNHMNSPLSYVDPTQVEHITVYASVPPVSAGGDSVGGSIQVDAPALTFAAPGSRSLTQGELGLGVRSHGGLSGHLNATHATEHWHLSLGTAYARADNHRAGGDFKTSQVTGRLEHELPLDEVGSTAYQSRNHQLNLGWQDGVHRVEARVKVQDMPYQLYPNQRMDLLDNQMERVSLRYLGEMGWGQLEARLHHETVDHLMDFGPDKRLWYGNGAPPTGSGGPMAENGSPCSPVGTATCARGMPMITQSQTTGARVQASMPWADVGTLRAGAEWQVHRLDDWWPPSGAGMSPGTFENIHDGRRERLGGYAEMASQPSPDWQVLAGVRVDRIRMQAGEVQGYNPAGMGNQGRDAALFNARDRQRTDHHLGLSLLARHQHSAHVDLDIGLARQTRSPSLYEAYPWSTWQMAALMNNTVGDGNGYIGNPDLKPETAHTLSTTLDWHSADRQRWLKVSPYITHISHYIDAVQWDSTSNAPRTTLLRDQFTTLRYANQSARLQGLDVSWHTGLGRNDWGQWAFSGQISHVRGTNRTTGDGLYQLMPLNAKLALQHRHGAWQGSIEGVTVAAKRRVSSVRNEISTPGYALLNLRGSHHWKHVRLDVGIDNVFDRLYALPQGGAYVGQGTTMTTTGTSSPRWGTAVPGAGRSLYANITMAF